MGQRLVARQLAIFAILLAPWPRLAAQEASGAADAIESAHVLYGPPPPMEACTEEQEASILSGEIVVCRRKRDDSQFRTLPAEDAETRYAQETMNKDNPQTPDVAGPGIFRGPATVGGLCLIGPCPKPPALMIDVAALPQAPPGSDAGRIARGLPPLGQEEPERPTPESRPGPR